MAGIRDDSAGSYGQWQSPDDWSWLDHVKAAGGDTGNALYNLSSNVIEGLSPFAPTATQYGKPSLQVPPMIQGIADSYSRLAGTPSQPGNAYDLTGVKELDAPIQQDMSNVLLSLYGGNAMAGVSKPAGSVGMFAGRNAKTADLNALSKAEQLAGQGATRDAIWNETGWFQGPDQKWRFEIDDSKSWLADWGFSSAQRAGDVMKHTDMFNAYPDLRDTKMRGTMSLDSSYDVASDSINVGMHKKNAALHEMQHAIQKREGFDAGGNVYAASNSHAGVKAIDDQISTLEARASDPSASLAEVRALDGEIRKLMAQKKDLRSDVGFDAYQQLPGEVEARLVESRMDMSPEQRRASPPWLGGVLSDTGKPSLFGSALATAGEQPKGALGAGISREASLPENALASHRLEGSQPPMPPQAFHQEANLSGRMPDLSQGQPAPAPRSLIENDPLPGSFNASPEEISYLRNIYENRSELPEGWYVHGRSRSNELRSDAPIQATKSFETMEQYGGKNGSGWAISPNVGADVFDMSSIDTPDARRLGAAALRDLRSGSLPFADDVSHISSARSLSEDIRSNFSPDDIVNSAQAYDNPDWLGWFADKFEPDFVTTPDGAVGLYKPALKAVRLFSDNRPSLFGSALATAGEQPFDLNEFLMRYSAQ